MKIFTNSGADNAYLFGILAISQYKTIVCLISINRYHCSDNYDDVQKSLLTWLVPRSSLNVEQIIPYVFLLLVRLTSLCK